MTTPNVSSWTTMCGISSRQLARTGFVPLMRVLMRPNGRRHGRLALFSERRARAAFADLDLPHQFELPASIRFSRSWAEKKEATRRATERACEVGTHGRWTVVYLHDTASVIFAFQDERDAVIFRLMTAE